MRLAISIVLQQYKSSRLTPAWLSIKPSRQEKRGTQGNKIGNAHLKWTFSEAAVLLLRNNNNANRYLEKLQNRMSKAKALSALAHKLGRCVYFMLKNETVFDEARF